MAQMYTSILVHVPTKAHYSLLKAVTQSRGLCVKLDLNKSPNHNLFVTECEEKEFKKPFLKEEKKLSFTAKQAKYNREIEGVFLSAMLAAAYRFLPRIIAGLVAGSAGLTEAEVDGNGHFLGKRDCSYHIRHMGDASLPQPSIRTYMVFM